MRLRSMSNLLSENIRETINRVDVVADGIESMVEY